MAVQGALDLGRRIVRTAAQSRVSTQGVALAFVLAAACVDADHPAFAVQVSIQSGPPPQNAREAMLSLPERRDIVATYTACGDEINFLRNVQGIATEPGRPLEPNVIGKMLWLILHPLQLAAGPSPSDPGGVFGGPAGPSPNPGGVFREPKFHDDEEELPLLLIQQAPPPAPAPAPDPDPCTHTSSFREDDFADVLTSDVPGLAILLPVMSRITNRSVDELKQLMSNPPPPGSGMPTFVDLRRTTLSELRNQEPFQYHLLISVLISEINTRISNEFGDSCALVASADGPSQPQFDVSYKVTHQCMKEQINKPLMRVEVHGQLGSSDLLCLLSNTTLGTVKGEWDVNVRRLIRIYYMDYLHKSQRILDDPTVTHIKKDLLTAAGPLGLPSYGLLQCGNQEENIGSAEERAADRSWLDDTLPAVASLWDWFRLRILLIIAVALAAGVLALLASGAGAILVAAGVVATLGATVLFIRIPESENHRLQIESSRYLNNQIIIEDLERAGQPTFTKYVDDNRGIKQFLLSKFRDVLTKDFDEYNAKPYQEYSINAILNLAEFAREDDLKLAARMALDYATAKAAVGSNRGRRLPPFRRLMETILTREHLSIFAVSQEGDFLVSYMMFYTGQTQQAWDELYDGDPKLEKRKNMLPDGMVDQMIGPASSAISNDQAPLTFLDFDRPLPAELVIDIAIDKSTFCKPASCEQRIRHAGAEVFSNGDGWLVTAGGIQSPAANEGFAQILGVDVPLTLLTRSVPTLTRNNDRGAAVPTTLMIAAGSAPGFPTTQTTLDDFIRIEGVRIKYPATVLVNDEEVDTFDGNLCVALGFACGFNLRTPEDFDKATCAVFPLAGNEKWVVFDSATCIPYKDDNTGAPRVFVVIYRETCPPVPNQTTCDNFGAFEVVSASDPAFTSIPEEQKFAEFVKRASDNADAIKLSLAPLLSLSEPVQLIVLANGTYLSVKENQSGGRHRISFDASYIPTALPLSLSRVVSIDGEDRPSHTDWKFANGDLIRGDGNGRVEIGRQGSSVLILDMTDKDNPIRGMK